MARKALINKSKQPQKYSTREYSRCSICGRPHAVLKKYGISSYKCILTNATTEKVDAKDFSESGKGGLKIQLFENSDKPSAFIWMRGSGTEPVFRIMCDVKGNNPDKEKDLLAWETKMLLEADKM